MDLLDFKNDAYIVFDVKTTDSLKITLKSFAFGGDFLMYRKLRRI